MHSCPCSQKHIFSLKWHIKYISWNLKFNSVLTTYYFDICAIFVSAKIIVLCEIFQFLMFETILGQFWRGNFEGATQLCILHACIFCKLSWASRAWHFHYFFHRMKVHWKICLPNKNINFQIRKVHKFQVPMISFANCDFSVRSNTKFSVHTTTAEDFAQFDKNKNYEKTKSSFESLLCGEQNV